MKQFIEEFKIAKGQSISLFYDELNNFWNSFTLDEYENLFKHKEDREYKLIISFEDETIY
jgi:hypothetical protein